MPNSGGGDVELGKINRWNCVGVLILIVVSIEV